MKTETEKKIASLLAERRRIRAMINSYATPFQRAEIESLYEHDLRQIARLLADARKVGA